MGADGVWTAEGLDPGVYDLEVFADGYGVARHVFTVVAGQPGRGGIAIAEPGPPTRLELNGPSYAAPGKSVRLVLRAWDAAGRPVAHGARVLATTSHGVLAIGETRGRGLELGLPGGPTWVDLSAATPGVAEVNVSARGVQAATSVTIAGAPASFALTLGTQARPWPEASVAPGEDLPLCVRCLDRHGLGVAAVPFLLSWRRLPDGPVTSLRELTGATGERLVYAATTARPGKYRAELRSGAFWASQDFEVGATPWRTLDVRTAWDGVLGRCRVATGAAGVTVVLRVEPAGRVAVVDADGRPLPAATSGADGVVLARLVRLAHGPAVLTAECGDGRVTWRAVGDTDLHLPPPATPPAPRWPVSPWTVDAARAGQTPAPRGADPAVTVTAAPVGGVWLAYAVAPQPVQRLLLVGGRVLSPVLHFGSPRRLAVAYGAEDPLVPGLTLRCHEPGRATRDLRYAPPEPLLAVGLDRVWDLAADGETLLAVTRPLPVEPAQALVWVLTPERAELVASGGQTVTGAGFNGERVWITGRQAAGPSTTVWYHRAEKSGGERR